MNECACLAHGKALCLPSMITMKIANLTFRELVPRHEVQGRVQIVAEPCQLILFYCSCLCYTETSPLPSQHLASVSSEVCFRYESWKCG